MKNLKAIAKNEQEWNNLMSELITCEQKEEAKLMKKIDELNTAYKKMKGV